MAIIHTVRTNYRLRLSDANDGGTHFVENNIVTLQPGSEGEMLPMAIELKK